VQVWDDSRIQYPMRFTASHGFRDVEPWPIQRDGTDLSIIKNQTSGPVSLFVHGSREPFMGVWNPHTRTGVVHYAEYTQLPAKKIWSWGTDPDGLDWRKALSDNDSAYVEVQAGLFRNQETYAFLEPRQTIRFSEFWMPVRDIGGISRANLTGVVHLDRQQQALVARLNVNQAIPQAAIRILADGREVFQQKADLSPQQTWSHRLEKAEDQQKYTFELRDSKGALLLQHTEGQYDWTPSEQIRTGPQPSFNVPDRDHRTEDDWLQLGNEQELNGALLAALQTYRDALARFPGSMQGRKGAGRLCASLLRYEEAKTLLEPVAARDTTDAEAAYYLGIAYEGLGQSREARESLESAERLPAFRAAAGVRLAELSARAGNLQQAESYLRSATRSTPDDPRAAEELSAVLGAEGKTDEAHSLASEWLARFPQRYFLLEQMVKPDLQHLADDAERVLNVASEFMRLGMYSRALDVLSRDYPTAVPDETEPGMLPPGMHPMVAYFRAYCREKLGQSPSADLNAATHLPTSYVFPSRREDLDALRTAVRLNAQDAAAHYLLGTLYFSRGLAREALSEWEQARMLNPQIPVLHASLGRALLHDEDNPDKALSVFQEGLRADPANIELYTGMDQALSIMRRPPQERVAALERYPDQAHIPANLVYELILNLVEAGEFDKAEALFHNRFFPREEGGINVREVWLELEVQRATSFARSGRCTEAVGLVDHLAEPVPDLPFTHDGLDPFVRSARLSYLIGNVYKVCGVRDKAQASFDRSAQQSGFGNAVWSWKASKELPDFDEGAAKQKVDVILEHSNTEGERSSWWLYNRAMLDTSVGNDQLAQKEFREALLAPDRLMAYHLTRLAMSSNPQGK
jgi:tetratricopeptide (TPR) repeat protein